MKVNWLVVLTSSKRWLSQESCRPCFLRRCLQCIIYTDRKKLHFVNLAFIKVSLDARLKSLTHQAPVMVFMKVDCDQPCQDIPRCIFQGNPSEPKCGFSRQLMTILQETKVKFSGRPHSPTCIVQGALLHFWHPNGRWGSPGPQDFLQLANIPPGLCKGMGRAPL